MSSRDEIKRRSHTMMNCIADRVDLAIDAITLGQYGLERVPDGDGCEGTGQTMRRAGWETRSQPTRPRGACEPAMSWDWPGRSRGAVSR